MALASLTVQSSPQVCKFWALGLAQVTFTLGFFSTKEGSQEPLRSLGCLCVKIASFMMESAKTGSIDSFAFASRDC